MPFAPSILCPEIDWPPFWPLPAQWTYRGLRDRYLPYVHANYDFIGENVDWWVFRRKGAATDEPKKSRT